MSEPNASRPYWAAGACLGLMPVVLIAGVAVHGMIDPEMAARHANYERNYRLLEALRAAVLSGTFLAVLSLWFAMCLLLLKAKRRSLLWTVPGILGPLGLALITALKPRVVDPVDSYSSFVAKLGIVSRIGYEVLLFMGICALAMAAVSIHADLMIAWSAHVQQVPIEQILQERDASSGMYAFSEAMEALYLIACLYLLLPAAANWIHRLLRRGRLPTTGPRAS